MAKYRHKIFEMFELRDEAVRALTPRTERAATEASAPESWEFVHLAVSREADVVSVRFKEPQSFDEQSVAEFRGDLLQLADRLGIDSRVLFDFSGVLSFNSACIACLTQFNRTLQTKGSRIALCCLDPSARTSFFAGG